jgi:hypothetical protein
LITPDSLGGFRITFHQTSYTDNDDNQFKVGLSDQLPTTDIAVSGDSLHFKQVDGSTRVAITEDDSSSSVSIANVNFDSDHNLSIEYDPKINEARFFVDGVLKYTFTGAVIDDAVYPFIKGIDVTVNSTGETFSVEQITVEPLGGVLQ